MFFIRIKDDETESTETSVLKSHLVNDVPVLASPDLLSEVSEMKQDLIKMTALLTTDVSDRAGPLKVKELARATEEEPGEPFEIVERVKEDLERVNEILRGGACPGAGPQSERESVGDGWVIVSDEEVEEARQRADAEAAGRTARAHSPAEGLQGPAAAQGEELPAVPGARGPESEGKGSPPGEPQRTQPQPKPGLGVKKPVRKKLKEKQKQKEESSQAGAGAAEPQKGSSGESSDGDPGLAPEPLPAGKATSPLVEETPIGSIKDKVKALQKRVEDEQKGRSKLPVRVKGKEDVPRRTSHRPHVAVSPPLKSPSSRAERHASLSSSAKSERHPPVSPPSKTDKTEKHSPVSPSTKTERHSPGASSGKTEKHSPVSPSGKVDKRPPVSPSGRIEKHPPVSPGRAEKRLPVSPAGRTDRHPSVSTPGKTEKRLSVSPSGKTEKAPVSPTWRAERIEESMSVRELMKAFQAGQDPSKHRAGLFEHKSAKPKPPQEKGKGRAEKEKGQTPPQKETQKAETQTLKRSPRLPGTGAGEPRRGPRGSSSGCRREDAAGGQETAASPQTPVPTQPAPEEGPAGELGDVGPQISPDRRTSTDFSEVIKQELEDNDQYQQFRRGGEAEKAQLLLDQVLVSPFDTAPPLGDVGQHPPALSFCRGPLDGSCESLKPDGAAGSPCGSLLEGTPQVSSEESYKHEGLAETPETSPESLSFSPRGGRGQPGGTSDAAVGEAPAEAPSGKRPVAQGVPDGAEEPGPAAVDGPEPQARHVPMAATPDPPAATDPEPQGDSLSGAVSSAAEAPAGLTEGPPARAGCSETQADCDTQGPTSPEPSPPEATVRTGPGAERQRPAAPRSPPGLELALPRPSTGILSPGADESLAVSHRDSLEASPVLEDNSSHKTPDSLEPSPLKESPCRDSLESSPVEPKMKADAPPGHFPLPAAVPKTELLTEVASVRCRLLRDPDGSAEDDSLEQTSLVESSGKSPLSPDTPSSEEVSYEVTPKASDASTPKPAVIHECAEEDDSENGEKKRFTPEEEMFKMVTKIKTFDELEQEARQRRDCRREARQEEPCAVPELDTDGPAGLTAERGAASPSPESELEPTRPRRAADAGLAPEPVIHVQPPSPRPSSSDSGSSPEDVHVRPAAPKQYTFRLKEDAQERPGDSDEGRAGDRRCDAVPVDGPETPCDDADRGADPPKPCVGHGCEAGGPSRPATPVPPGLRSPPGAHGGEGLVVHEEPLAARDTSDRDTGDRDTEGEEFAVSRAESPQVAVPSEGLSSFPSLSHCPASEGKELGGDVISPPPAAGAVTRTGPASAGSAAGGATQDSPVTTETDQLSTVLAADPAETGEACDPQVVSPYENVPSQTFFSGEESRTQTDARHTNFHSSEVCSVTVASSVEGAVAAGPQEPRVRDQSVEIEPLESALWEVPSGGATAPLEPATPDPAAVAGGQVSRVIITKTEVESDSWSEIREDDAAFEARVKEEEQKIFGLMVDRQSQGTTPDTTPARTPTEEGTPASEQNPFLFQEGKLFEMTRSGAIDMTRRSCADESFHFFQIGRESEEEALPEDRKEGGTAAEPPQLETAAEPPALAESKDSVGREADVLPDGPSRAAQAIPASEAPFHAQAATPAPADPLTPEATSPAPSGGQWTAGPQRPEQGARAQADLPAVPRGARSGRDGGSPDSSPEEQRSVIEIPTAAMESVPPAEGEARGPGRTGPAPTAGRELGLSEDVLSSPEDDSEGEEAEPGSKVPMEVPSPVAEQWPLPLDSSLQEMLAPQGQGGPDRAAGPPGSDTRCAGGSETRCAGGSRSDPEAAAESGERAEEPEPGATSPPGGGQQRLLGLCRGSIEFFEEVSDEASRLADRLAQAEREQQGVASDEESSSALEVSVTENLPPVETEHSVPEDIFDTRPIWDESVETLIERIPDDSGHDRAEGIATPGVPVPRTHVLSPLWFSCVSVSVGDSCLIFFTLSPVAVFV